MQQPTSSCEDCGSGVELHTFPLHSPSGAVERTMTLCEDCLEEGEFLECRDCGHHFAAKTMSAALCERCAQNHPEDCDCEYCLEQFTQRAFFFCR